MKIRIHMLLLIAALILIGDKNMPAENAVLSPKNFVSEESDLSSNITCQAMVITLENVVALEFIMHYDLNKNPDEAFTELRRLVQINKATTSRVISVQGKSGQMALTKAGDTQFWIDPIISRLRGYMDVTAMYQNAGSKISTWQGVKNGVRRFIGSVANPINPTSTDFVFITLTCEQPKFAQVIPPDSQEDRWAWSITAQGLLFALPTDTATEFSSQHNMDEQPAEALGDIQRLVLQKKATIMDMPAVSNKSGLQAISQFADGKMTISTTLDALRNIVNLFALFEYAGGNLQKEFSVYPIDVKFMGSYIDPKTPSSTVFVFIRTTFPEVKSVYPEK
ncbi:MAG: hypothetical protein ABIP97_07800 [Chthoniobacterales bacterium]